MKMVAAEEATYPRLEHVQGPAAAHHLPDLEFGQWQAVIRKGLNHSHDPTLSFDVKTAAAVVGRSIHRSTVVGAREASGDAAVGGGVPINLAGSPSRLTRSALKSK